MAGTTMAAVKAVLRKALSAELSGIQVTYGDPGKLARRETVWFGAISRGDQDPVALKAGRRRRDEDYVLEVNVEVVGRPTPEANEARAVEIATTIEEYLADNPKLDGSVGDLLWAFVSGMEMTTDETTDGPRTVLLIEITVRGRLL